MDVDSVTTAVQKQIDFLCACGMARIGEGAAADPSNALDMVRGLMNGAAVASCLWLGLALLIHG